MKRTRLGALLVAAGMLVAACGGAATPAPSAAPSAEASQAPSASAAQSVAPSAAAVKEGGTLVVAIPGDIKRTDSALVDDGNTAYVALNVMEAWSAWPRARRTRSSTCWQLRTRSAPTA